MNKKQILVAVTGASGSMYAQRLIEKLENEKDKVHLSIVFSDIAYKVWETEIGTSPKFGEKIWGENDFMAPFASGSSVCDAMIVVPCTMGSMSKIAHGIADNLITRAADVVLKEKKQLIIVPRETPFNLIHIQNMEKLILAGAQILPASPSFYSCPKTIEDLVDTLVFRIMDQIGISHEGFKW
jgi:4-hydroxy-3-polyprenylbenzoate decarboxylase